MNTVHAIYSEGVFRPTARVDLPDNAEVEFEPRVVTLPDNGHDQTGVHDVLRRRFRSGQRDVAQRHTEHQP